MVADAVSLAVGNLYDYRESAYENGWTTDDLDYKLCLQVHDAILSLVRYEHVPYYIDTVLPTCMVDSVPIYPCYLDGLPTGAGPYYLGIDTEPYIYWGIVPTPGELEAFGINPKYAHWKPSEAKIDGTNVKGLMQKEAYPKQIWYDGALHKIDSK